MPAQAQYLTRVKAPTGAVLFVFSFENFPILKAVAAADAPGGIAIAGQTIVSATVLGPGGAALSGIAAGSVAVTTVDRVVDSEGTIVPAGKGVECSVTGGTDGTDYVLECRAVFSGGGSDVVWGKVAVRNVA